jgi:UDP-2,3-diacylglucosamine hydrolase
MDVSETTVEAVFHQYGYVDMIHGHTHRPATHVHMVDYHPCTRQVLADWHTQAELVRVDQLGQRQAST